jgi:hypothetical protein
MPGNRTETRDECNFETTVSYDPCQASVRKFCPFKLFASRSTAIFECAIQKSVLFSDGNVVCRRTRSFQLHQERCQRRQFQTQATSPTPAHIISQQFHVRRAKAKALRNQGIKLCNEASNLTGGNDMTNNTAIGTSQPNCSLVQFWWNELI